MRDKNVTVGYHKCRMTPETLTSQTRAIIWSVSVLRSAMASNVPPTPATEEAIVDCVAFFTRRGKATRIFERKTSLDVK